MRTALFVLTFCLNYADAVNGKAKLVTLMATKNPARNSEVSKYLSSIGRKGGKASGIARMRKLTHEQRVAVARTAATARWARMDRVSVAASVNVASAR
jgi:hypothetical protein